jgi:hypothetical protein
MGGSQAPDDLDQGHRTQVWLAASDDSRALVTGEYFFHLKLRKPLASVRDSERQEKLIADCERLSGVELATN